MARPERRGPYAGPVLVAAADRPYRSARNRLARACRRPSHCSTESGARRSPAVEADQRLRALCRRAARARRHDHPAGRRAAGRRRALQDQFRDPLSHAIDLVAFGDLCRARRRASASATASRWCWSRPSSAQGVIASPLSKYDTFNTRICRPVGLTPEDRVNVIRYAVERIGYAYDLKNIIDLMRYFLPQPPVPASWRRRMIALGSGEPTRAICSSLIAQAFESVGYPILPEVRRVDDESRREILHIRHHSLYAPRDFDVSPFFAVVKPTIETGFNYKQMKWDRAPEPDTRTWPATTSADESGASDMHPDRHFGRRDGMRRSRLLRRTGAAVRRACAGAQARAGRRVLSRQDRQRADRRRRRRRIRHPGAARGAAHRQAHPRQSDRGAAEHDRRRRAADDQLSLQRRAARTAPASA